VANSGEISAVISEKLSAVRPSVMKSMRRAQREKPRRGGNQRDESAWRSAQARVSGPVRGAVPARRVQCGEQSPLESV
jgi:hypothetical protein